MPAAQTGRSWLDNVAPLVAKIVPQTLAAGVSWRVS